MIANKKLLDAISEYGILTVLEVYSNEVEQTFDSDDLSGGQPTALDSAVRQIKSAIPSLKSKAQVPQLDALGKRFHSQYVSQGLYAEGVRDIFKAYLEAENSNARIEKTLKGLFLQLKNMEDPVQSGFATEADLEGEEMDTIKESLEEATPQITSTKIVKDRGTGEYIVKAFVNGKRYPDGDYFTDDMADAKGTAKEMVKESMDEGKMTFSNKVASWFTSTVLNNVKHPVYGKHQVTPDQIKASDGKYKDKLFKAMKKAYDDGDLTDDHIKMHEAADGEPTISSRKAANLMKKFLTKEGIPFTKVKGSTTSFSGLGYGTGVFATIDGWKPDKVNADKAKAFARKNGFIASFRGPGIVGHQEKDPANLSEAANDGVITLIPYIRYKYMKKSLIFVDKDDPSPDPSKLMLWGYDINGNRAEGEFKKQHEKAGKPIKLKIRAATKHPTHGKYLTAKREAIQRWIRSSGQALMSKLIKPEGTNEGEVLEALPVSVKAAKGKDGNYYSKIIFDDGNFSVLKEPFATKATALKHAQIYLNANRKKNHFFNKSESVDISEASPAGKMQKAVYEYLTANSGSHEMTDMIRSPAFRGTHVAKIQSAVDALVKKGLIRSSGGTVSVNETFSEERGEGCATPGKKIRSKGKGRGLAKGKGEGPMGRPYDDEDEDDMDEGKKRFNVKYNVGKAKYVINHHDGKQTHKDGSDFFGISIYKNKKDFEKGQQDLIKKGYIEEDFADKMATKAGKKPGTPEHKKLASKFRGQKKEAMDEAKDKTIKVGNIVRHKTSFLRSISWYTNVPKNGKVTKIIPLGQTSLAVVDWSAPGEEAPVKVNVANLEKLKESAVVELEENLETPPSSRKCLNLIGTNPSLARMFLKG